MNILRKLLAIATMAWLAAAVPAHADVRYVFTALSGFIPVSGTFTYETPTFVTSNIVVASGDLTSCTVTIGGACGAQSFYPDTTSLAGNPIYSAIGFGTTAAETYYYFDLGALGAAGSYNTVLFGPSQAATLEVSVFGATVPEPATWATMILGFGVVGFSLRHRRRAIAAVAYA